MMSRKYINIPTLYYIYIFNIYINVYYSIMITVVYIAVIFYYTLLEVHLLNNM
jgi:hypothetical protein